MHGFTVINVLLVTCALTGGVMHETQDSDCRRLNPTVASQEFEVASVKINRSGRQQSSLSRSHGQVIFDNVSLRE
jgi:hypothetical protein